MRLVPICIPLLVEREGKGGGGDTSSTTMASILDEDSSLDRWG